MATTAQDCAQEDRQLETMERRGIYATNQAALAALELTAAMPKVLTEQFGPSFADKVRCELRRRVAHLDQGGLDDRFIAPIVSEIAAWDLWRTDGRSKGF
jgi:hypothetical protein